MKKSIVGVVLTVGLALAGVWLAQRLGPHDTEELGAEAIQAMEEYRTLLAPVRSPKDVRAIESQEATARGKALEAGRRFVRDVLDKKKGKKDTRDRFLELSDKFLQEHNRYDELFAKDHPELSKK